MAASIIYPGCDTYTMTAGSGDNAVTWNVIEIGNCVILSASKAFTTAAADWAAQGGNQASSQKTMALPFSVTSGYVTGSSTPHYTWLANLQILSGSSVSFRIMRAASSTSSSYTETATVVVIGFKA